MKIFVVQREDEDNVEKSLPAGRNYFELGEYFSL